MYLLCAIQNFENVEKRNVVYSVSYSDEDVRNLMLEDIYNNTLAEGKEKQNKYSAQFAIIYLQCLYAATSDNATIVINKYDANNITVERLTEQIVGMSVSELENMIIDVEQIKSIVEYEEEN